MIKSSPELNALAIEIGMMPTIKVESHWQTITIPNPTGELDLFEVYEFVQKSLGIRVFPKQKVNGHFGVEYYEVNTENPVGLPFRRNSGNSVYNLNFNSFIEAIDGGLVYVLKNRNNKDVQKYQYNY